MCASHVIGALSDRMAKGTVAPPHWLLPIVFVPVSVQRDLHENVPLRQVRDGENVHVISLRIFSLPTSSEACDQMGEEGANRPTKSPGKYTSSFEAAESSVCSATKKTKSTEEEASLESQVKVAVQISEAG